MSGNDTQTVPLDQVGSGHTAVIADLVGDPIFQVRLRNMGFREGETVEVVKQAPLADPVEYRIEGAHVSLRRAEARHVRVADVRPVSLAPCRGRRRRLRRGWGRRGF